MPNISKHSSAIEYMVQVSFEAELLQTAWTTRGLVIDVLHSSVDAYGYDLVLNAHGAMRQVQLKSRTKAGKASRYTINTVLSDQPSGCVVWIGHGFDESSASPLEYRWFGGPPGQPLPALPDQVAKHTKPNAQGVKSERPSQRTLGLGKFERLAGMNELLNRLFGPE